MTVSASFTPYGLGGFHGGYRPALATASGGPVDPANSTNLGTVSSHASAPDRAIEDSGIRAGEIIAYRVWLYDNGLLRSMFANYVWQPKGIEHAVDLRHYGLHAFKTPFEAERQYCFFDATYRVVYGRVALWGQVIEHELGYRAEFAKVHAIDSTAQYFDKPRPRKRWWRKVKPYAPDLLLANLQDRYGVSP